MAVRLNGALTIGRGRLPDGAVHDPDAKVILLSDRLLSRQHLRIQTRPGGYEVEDLESTNGLLVDGQPVDKPRSLSDGSIVLFGNHAGVFRRASAAELAALEEERARPFGPVATTSPSFALTLAKLRRLAATDADLLFVGETGVGKEVYSRAVHEASGRKGPFLAINCAAIPAELVESELYGYVRGAHSTATQPKAGLHRAGGRRHAAARRDRRHAPGAAGEDLPLPAGSTAVAAGGDDAAAGRRARAGGDQQARRRRAPRPARASGSDPIEIPPLRERVEDIAALAAYFGGDALRGLEPAAFRALHLYAWPLNVRELASAITRAVAIAGGEPVALEHLPKAVAAALKQGAPIAARRRYRTAPSKEELEALLRDQQGNVAAVAKSLDRQWSVVKKWLQRYKLRADRFRD